MEFKKKIIALFALAFAMHGLAQDIYDGERAGLLQTTASIYPSVQLNTTGINYYVGGNLNYHFDDKYSFRGDIYTLAGSKEKPSYIQSHTQIQAGFMRYFPVKRFDPFIGIQMGFSTIDLNERPNQLVYNASLSFLAGIDFHVYKYFYFFAEFQYTHQQDPWHTRPLDQFMGTGGLGIQLPCKKS